MLVTATRPSGELSSQTSVLIVDDDRGFGRAAAELLADRGFRVLGQATTAVGALAMCDRLDPDAVLVDVRLPDADGVVLAEKLRSRPDRPRVLLTSSDRNAVASAPLRQSGATGFIPKTELARSNLDRFLK
ncbi:MAG TPA: response regulator [Solirubrobacteraceae bacterium]|nr:response regulator [Solirubrobacteraceae bacterium]